MPPTVVHFFNIVLGGPPCLPDIGREAAIAFVDPARVTCPECLCYLGHEPLGGGSHDSRPRRDALHRAAASGPRDAEPDAR